MLLDSKNISAIKWVNTELPGKTLTRKLLLYNLRRVRARKGRLCSIKRERAWENHTDGDQVPKSYRGETAVSHKEEYTKQNTAMVLELPGRRRRSRVELGIDPSRQDCLVGKSSNKAE